MIKITDITEELRKDMNDVLNSYERVCEKITRIEKQLEKCTTEYHNEDSEESNDNSLYIDYKIFKKECEQKIISYEYIKEGLEQLIFHFTGSIDYNDMVKDRNRADECFDKWYR